MVTQNMLRTHKGKQVFPKKIVTALDLIKCLKTDQITVITPYVRAYY